MQRCIDSEVETAFLQNCATHESVQLHNPGEQHCWFVEFPCGAVFTIKSGKINIQPNFVVVIKLFDYALIQ
jgi:hypothetical protein